MNVTNYIFFYLYLSAINIDNAKYFQKKIILFIFLKKKKTNESRRTSKHARPLTHVSNHVDKGLFSLMANTGLQKVFPIINFHYSVSFSPTEYEFESHFFPSRLDFPKICGKVLKINKIGCF